MIFQFYFCSIFHRINRLAESEAPQWIIFIFNQQSDLLRSEFVDVGKWGKA